MKWLQCFTDEQLAQLRDVCLREPLLAALYAFDLRGKGDCNLAALFVEAPLWPDRLNLELGVSEALDLESVELINLRRMSLVARFDVISRGQPLYVGLPESLAIFIEQTTVRYSAFYPLLEALYWEVETHPLAEDRLW